MGVKLFKRKKNKQSSVGKTLNTPSKVGTNNEAHTPDTAPGSPIPQQDDLDLLASTPKNDMAMTPNPTSYNQRIMEGETPLVSNLASSNPQFGRNNSSGVPHLSNTPEQVKSNQIRDEIGQYYDERDREVTRDMTNKQITKPPVTRTFTQPAVGVRAFSVDESEDVEVQLSSDLPFQVSGPVGNNGTTQRKNIATTIATTRSRSSTKLVPKFVSKPNQDEVSVPSVITDPDAGLSVKSLSVVKENEVLNAPQQEPESTWSKVSLKNKMIDGGQSIDDAIKSLFSADQKTSAATQAGGIEQLLGFLQCNEDTTCGPMLQCDALCGPSEVKEKDAVDLENEQEQQFALKFNNQIIREGIKVIYHEPPPKQSSTTLDWSQSTVKIFLRPGDCHNKKLMQPCLAWAVLQVASRFNDADTFNTEEKCLWHRLELMDIDTIVAAPEEQLLASGNGFSPDSDNSVSTSTFFSITALSTGSVHIFEAATVMERDYIIRGMKGIISRLAFNIIAGNTDVIGEHFSEDAGQMTGELPSLRSPRQALRDLTHTFLDERYGSEEKKKDVEILL
ncbi:hypothetical protein QTG54_011353 [Skeletonema marinoi]|uniref:Uncharacterized protein n=2 Tax=Skeletonema marinoi TaxID=267567 RepID=A0AAD9D9Q2_9STRA|nr:hypothetical protein QTG54_011353 [Skeletonema marinoi]